MNRENRIKILILLLLAVLVYFFTITENGASQQSYKDKFIRLHVIANSNTKEDQELKLIVRDEIIKSLNESLLLSEDIEESRSIIKGNIENIENIAHKTLIKNGYVYPIKAQLGMTWIPKKTYGNVTFPAGEYEALNVIIGEGKGENWWCVLFPPLCLIDSKEGEIGDVKEALTKTLTEEEYELFINAAKEEAPVIQLKFKTLETAEELKANLEKIITKINKATASIY